MTDKLTYKRKKQNLLESLKSISDKTCLFNDSKLLFQFTDNEALKLSAELAQKLSGEFDEESDIYCFTINEIIDVLEK